MFIGSKFGGNLRACAAAFMLIAVSAVPAEAVTWRNYHNTRFGVTGDVPASWKMQPAPMNNDGRAFVSPDGKASLTLSGIFSTSPHEEEIADRLKPDDGETITKSSSDATHVRVEGTNGPNGFVRASILSCSGKIWNDLVLTYPSKDAASYQAIIDRAVTSFHSGRGYDMSCG